MGWQVGAGLSGQSDGRALASKSAGDWEIEANA